MRAVTDITQVDEGTYVELEAEEYNAEVSEYQNVVGIEYQDSIYERYINVKLEGKVVGTYDLKTREWR